MDVDWPVMRRGPVFAAVKSLSPENGLPDAYALGMPNVYADRTRIFNSSEGADALLDVGYGQFRRIMRQRMSARRRDHTLQAAAFVSEISENRPRRIT